MRRAAEITRQLELNESLVEKTEDGGTQRVTAIPSERTVQEIVRDLNARDDSGIWSVAHARPGDAQLVLPVLAFVFRESKGKVYHFSKGVAKWVARLRRAAPEIPLPAAYSLARLYHSCQGQDERDYQVLDLFLALNGWEMPPPSVISEMVRDIAQRTLKPKQETEAEHENES